MYKFMSLTVYKLGFHCDHFHVQTCSEELKEVDYGILLKESRAVCSNSLAHRRKYFRGMGPSCVFNNARVAREF